LLVKGYFASKSRGWRCGWERKVVIPIRKHQLLLNLPSCVVQVVQEESNIQLYWQAREYKIIGQESRKGSDLPLTVR